jgi:hypothetical protein
VTEGPDQRVEAREQAVESGASAVAVTETAAGVQQTKAAPMGNENSESAETKCHFESGRTDKYEKKTTEASAGSASVTLVDSNVIKVLEAGTPCHFRIVAMNDIAPTHGKTGGRTQLRIRR